MSNKLNKNKLVIISGTPGTGKAKLAQLLVKDLGFERLNIHKHYSEISSSYIREKQCYDVNLKKLEYIVNGRKKELTKKNKENRNLVLDTHIAHLLPKRMVNLCIIIICSNLKTLKRRLQKKKYSKKKIRENLDAEIFQVCLNEAKEKKHKIIIFDTAKRISKKEYISKIKQIL